MEIKISIHNFNIGLDVDNDEVALKLKNDFSYFLQERMDKIEFKISAKKVESYQIPQNLIAKKQSQNSITFDFGNIRYNDYYGQAYTVFDYTKESVEVYYIDENILHEIIYLLILSRSGKWLDKNGMHRIHACGFTLKDKNIILMLPSKGGKTTSLLELVQDQEVGLISDDSPLVDTWGNIHAFPLRIGIENKSKVIEQISYLKDDDFYEFKRKYYSKKYLLPLFKLKNKVEVKDKTILLSGKRSTYTSTQIYKVSKLKMMNNLINYMIVGIGLPLILEYFIQNKVKDHFVNLLILFKRIISSVSLLIKSECYEVFLSDNPQESIQSIKEFFYER